MGDKLGEQDGYPAGVSNSHPHFHEPEPVYPAECQDGCGFTVNDAGVCETCGAQHEPEEPDAGS